MKTKNIRQVIKFGAEPHEIYEAYMDSRKHAAFTGETVKMTRKVGAKFTAGSGYIDGKNLELAPDGKIVQTWRGDDWPEGHYSELTMTLKRVEGGTQLTIFQKGVPEDQCEAISDGWHKFYWGPLKEWLKNLERP